MMLGEIDREDVEQDILLALIERRRFFDPAAYRIVIFDQRGAGRSTPLGDITDNTTVHLGGALGAPVSVLLPFHPDWRWQLNRSDSPWYPSLTLLRQHIPGNWAAPLQALRQYLSGEDHGR